MMKCKRSIEEKGPYFGFQMPGLYAAPAPEGSLGLVDGDDEAVDDEVELRSLFISF